MEGMRTDKNLLMSGNRAIFARSLRGAAKGRRKKNGRQKMATEK